MWRCFWEILYFLEVNSHYFHCSKRTKRCNAARNFSIEVLHWPLESVPCAIITGLTCTTTHYQHKIDKFNRLKQTIAPNCSVHHLNTRTMKDKRINRSLFRQRARVVMDRYKTLFPNWSQQAYVCICFFLVTAARVLRVQEDVRRSTNPLDPVNGPRYRKITQIDRSCPNK